MKEEMTPLLFHFCLSAIAMPLRFRREKIEQIAYTSRK